jgi:hypothetical protein
MEQGAWSNMRQEYANSKTTMFGAISRIGRTVVAGLGLAPFLVGVPLGYAEKPTNPISIGGISGMVTEVREHTVLIDGREYGFSPKVVVLDHEGHEAELSYVTRKSEVNFRVMKDDSQKIERIIVHHPE